MALRSKTTLGEVVNGARIKKYLKGEAIKNAYAIAFFIYT
jgi:hypothetical protein